MFTIIFYAYRNISKEKAAKLSPEQIKAFMVMSNSLMLSNLFSLIMPINENTAAITQNGIKKQRRRFQRCRSSVSEDCM